MEANTDPSRFATLEARVQELTEALQRTRGAHEMALERCRQVQTELEAQVKARSTELTRANQDLQRQILERRRVEFQLQQNQKMRAIGTLAGGIAHDFNNILAAILGYTEMAMMDIETASPVHRRLGNVLKACDRARDLVQQILTFSRQNDAEIRPLAPLPILKETVKLLRSGLPSTIEIESRLPSQLPMVLADPANLHQVVMNLCTNAREAMIETGGRLTVAAEVIELTKRDRRLAPELLPGHYLELKVADTGVGIAPEVLDRVFDPYFTTQTRKNGAGLGLAVVHGIVHRHGGSIHIDSTLGRGTTVTVRLPVADTEKAPAAIGKGPVKGGREHILFVDDEQTLVQIGQQMLERLGYTVTCRTSSVEALEALRANPDRFDLVITDQTMPNMTGTELSRQIQILRPDLPVILCTGFSETIGSEKALASGIRGFLLKPIALRDMSESIRQALDQPAS
ncbi:MAG: ATP-binding protein [Desulfobacteraceae bacterium]|jgi:signal transduction histidine kinase/ActR/RegA family two-component response regulator|nr:ATP-binding protein [Desulfobacteraceae bacterium]